MLNLKEKNPPKSQQGGYRQLHSLESLSVQYKPIIFEIYVYKDNIVLQLENKCQCVHIKKQLMSCTLAKPAE